MKVTLPTWQRASGSILLSTIVITAIIGLTLATFLTLVSNQHQLVVRSQVWNGALPVAEAGIEEALTHCSLNALNLACNGWTLSGGVYVKTNIVSDGGKSGASQAFLRRNNGFYGVSITPTQPYVIRSTGYYLMPGTTDRFVTRSVQVIATNEGLYSLPLLVKEGIDMNGNNVLTDSYDSTDPAKSTGGQYDPLKAGDKGDVASASGVTNSFKVGNANVWGKVMTTPSGGIYTGPMGAVGSTNWQRSGKSGVEPGWLKNDLNTSIPDVTAPFTSATPPASAVIGGVNYGFVLGSGNYSVGKLNANTIVTGDAVLYVSSGINFSSGETITILPGASLKIYNASADATFNTINNSNGPVAFQYLGLNSNDGTITMNGNNHFYGCIDAPYAMVKLSGSGQISGCIIARNLKMNGNAAIHYDESLRGKGRPRGLAITFWDEI